MPQPHQNLEPIFVLSGLDEYDDTIFVVCHWHYQPDQHEIDGMIATVGNTDGLTFFVSHGNVPKMHEVEDEDAASAA